MKKTLGIVVTLLVVLGVATFGLAANQTVNVIIPASSSLTLDTNAVTISFPTIDTWAADTFTATSNNFNIITHHNGSNNPDIQVASGDLTNSDGVALERSRFNVFVTPQQQAEQNGVLNSAAGITIPDIGRGRKTATAHYALTIDAAQQSGTYTGTVVFTLVNQ